MYLTLLLLPAIGATAAGLLGRKIGTYGSQLVTTACITGAALLAWVSFYEVALLGQVTTMDFPEWIGSALYSVSWSIAYDQLTVSILVTVLTVSACVHIFSIDYMAQDPHVSRFFSYLSIFTFFMLVLVVADSYPVLFIGWEGIGVSSYLLINFWYTRVQANKSAINAIYTNRVGDLSLSVGYFSLFTVMGSIDYSTVYIVTPFINQDVLAFTGLALLVAAMGKSAQFGLHVWLPQAIEGPTPVSALIHAATLVTAGVYLLMRSSPLLEYAPSALLAITWVGCLTAFFAASVGLFQNDLKRVIAYSTCSQMGYLFIACGLSEYSTALFHLVNHAFFKALLFLSAGALLHATYDQQDQRKIGGLIGLLPYTYVCILIGSLSLIAVPFMTGYYSKDLILELAYSQFTANSRLVYFIGTIAAGLTALYSFRLITLAFRGYPNGSHRIYMNAHDAPIIVMLPLCLLSLLAIFFGYMARDIFIGVGSASIGTSLYTHASRYTMLDVEIAVPLLVKMLPLLCTIAGASWALSRFGEKYSLVDRGYTPVSNVSTQRPIILRFLRFFSFKYYMDPLYHGYVVQTVLRAGYSVSKLLDRGAIEQLGPHGMTLSVHSASLRLSKNDTGVLTDYSLYMVLAIVVFTNAVISTAFEVYYPGTVLSLTLVLVALVLGEDEGKVRELR